MALALKLPKLDSNGRSWHLDAACRTLDPAIFFSPDDERGPRKRHRDAVAKSVCATCPVKKTCLDWAVTVHEPYGIWGGLTSAERALLTKPAAA